jgi:dTDP-4-amino-4,6-dideoxygalactose transaminase
VNSRLDDLQAAVLRARLPLLAERTIMRRSLAARYRQLLPASLRTIRERDPGHVYHLFPVLTPERASLQAHLSAHGIETMVHYPAALTTQPAFAAFASHECPVAVAAAGQLLSLPLSPRLTDEDVVRVAESVSAFVKGHRPA